MVSCSWRVTVSSGDTEKVKCHAGWIQRCEFRRHDERLPPSDGLGAPLRRSTITALFGRRRPYLAIALPAVTLLGTVQQAQAQAQNEAPPSPAPLEGSAIQPIDEALREGEEELEALYGFLRSEALVTVATKREETTQEAPSIVTVITRRQIEEMGYRSVGEALREVPGLYVIDDFITQNVAVRGVFGGADSWSRIIKVLVDGMPATELSTGGNFLGPEFIPMTLVESIEVIRGPASPLYGANAFLGVVNVVTRTPEQGVHGSVEGRIGFVQDNLSYGGTVTASARAGDAEGINGWLTLSARAARFDRSGLPLPDTSPSLALFEGRVSENDLNQPHSVYARAHLVTPETGTFDATLLRQGIDSRADFNDVGVLTHNSRFVRLNTVVSLRHQLDLELGEGTLSFNTAGQGTFGEVSPREQVDSGDARFFLRRERSSDALLILTEASYTLDDHLFLIGFDQLFVDDSGDTLFEEDRGSGNRTLRSVGEGVSYRNTGIYGQAAVSLSERLTLTGNLRLDANSLWDDNFSWRFGVAWQPTDQLYFKALYGSSFVAPAPTQLSLVPLRLGAPIGSSDLNSQRAQTVEIAGGFTDKEMASVDLTGFFTQVDDRVEFVNSGLNIQSRNLTSSRTFGVELSGQLRYGPFVTRGSLSLALTDLEEPTPLPSYWNILYGDDAVGSGLPGVPAVMGHLITTVTLPELFTQATLAIHGYSGRKSSFSNTERSGQAYLLSEYVTVDINIRSLGLGEVLPPLQEISFRVLNVFDTAYADVGNLGSDLPAVGRTMMLELKVGL